MTAFGKSIRHMYQTSGHVSLADWCSHIGIKYGTVRHWAESDTEPTWLRTLRTIKRRTGLSWPELLDGKRPARIIQVSNPDTDKATGHSECSVCGWTVDCWDSYCRHCGAEFREEE